MTQVSDEANETLQTTTQIHALLDKALGPEQYWGVFNVILHSDYGDHRRLNDLVADAQQRNVPVVSSAQMLDWLDGRNGSSFGNISYSNGGAQFSLSTNAKARGLEAMLPARSASGPLSRLERDGQPVSWNAPHRQGHGLRGLRRHGRRVLGDLRRRHDRARRVRARRHRLTARGTPPSAGRPTSLRPRSSSTAAPPPSGRRSPSSAEVTDHEVELGGLAPDTTYHFRVSSTDTAGNTTTSPAVGSAPATFQTPPDALVDSRTLEFAAGTQSNTRAGADPRRARRRGSAEARRSPTTSTSDSLSGAWTSRAFDTGGGISLAGRGGISG